MKKRKSPTINRSLKNNFPSDPLRPDLKDYPENLPLAERESLAGENQVVEMKRTKLRSRNK
jgi:hypothetical protein